MKAEWIFFQIDYLYAFNQILSNGEIFSNKEFKRYNDILTKVVRSFFEAFEKNQFLLVESLFRYTDFKQKNLILNNYEDQYDQDLKNLIDLEPEQNNKQAELINKWTQNEDEVLIENYETYKNLGDETEICEMLQGMISSESESIKSINEIRKRIKYLGVARGQDYAKQVLEQTYGKTVNFSN